MKSKYFKSLKKAVNSNKTQKDMDNAINALDLDVVLKEDKLFTELFENCGEFDTNNLPLALESLYKSDEKAKNFIFCILFELTCTKLPYVTNLESFPLFEEKFTFIYHTLVEVFCKCFNGIGDCAALIILNNDPKLSLASEEAREKILSSISTRLAILKEFIEEQGCEDEEAVSELSVTLDLTSYANNDEIIALLGEIAALPLAPECKLFLLKTMACNGFAGTDKLACELVDYDASRLFRILNEIGKNDILEGSGITQEKIAYSDMKNWLAYPTECGDSLEELLFVDTLDYNENIYYIFKFTSSKFPEDGYMIAVAGGYSKDGISENLTGHTFSDFETIKDDYKQQAIGIIDKISDYWRNRTDEMKSQ